MNFSEFYGDATTVAFYLNISILNLYRLQTFIWKIIHTKTHSCQFLFLEISDYQDIIPRLFT